MKNFYLLFFLILLMKCSNVNMNNRIFFSDSLGQINYNLEKYFDDSYPYQTSSPHILPALQQSNKYSIINYSGDSEDQPISGLIYPQLVTSRIFAKPESSWVQLKWWNQTNQQFLSEYSFSTGFTTIKSCSFAIKTIDYGIYKTFPFYQILGLCQNSTHHKSLFIKKYRASNSYQLIEGNYYQNNNQLTYTRLKTSYIYDGSSYSTIVSRKFYGKQFGYEIFKAVNPPDPLIFTSQTISAKIGLYLEIVDVLFGLGSNGNTTAYLDKRGLIIFYDGLKYNSWLLSNTDTLVSFYKLCWSSTLGVYSDKRLFFITFQKLQQITDHGYVATQPSLSFIPIGEYLVGYSQSKTYFYSLKDKKIFQRFSNQSFKVNFQNGFQQDLCSSNSFYQSKYKKQIAPYRIAIKQSQKVNFKFNQSQLSLSFEIISPSDIVVFDQSDSMPYNNGKIDLRPNIFVGSNMKYRFSSNSNNLTLNLWQQINMPKFTSSHFYWIDLSSASFFMFGQQQSDISFYLCVWGSRCKFIDRLRSQSLNEQCQMNLQNISSLNDQKIIHILFSSTDQSIYLQFLSEKGLQISFLNLVRLNDTLYSPQYLYCDYNNVKNFEISYIAKTSVENNAFCHYYIRMNLGKFTANFNYVYEFQSNGYEYCAQEQFILMYRVEPDQLLVKKVGLRQKRYFVLEDLKSLVQYGNSSVKCSSRGLLIAKQNSIISLDSHLNTIYKLKGQNYWNDKTAKEIIGYIMIQNTYGFQEIYQKQSGILITMREFRVVSTSFSQALCFFSQLSCTRYNDAVTVEVDKQAFSGNFTLIASNGYDFVTKEYTTSISDFQFGQKI